MDARIHYVTLIVKIIFINLIVLTEWLEEPQRDTYINVKDYNIEVKNYKMDVKKLPLNSSVPV
jgi:hypothetical protein